MGTIAFFLVELRHSAKFGILNNYNGFLVALFQSVSARTAGFNSIDIAKMSNAGLFIMIGLMFIGASPGGTGGGIKTTTIRVLTSCTKSILLGKQEVILYERKISISLILKAIGVLVGSVGTVITSTVLISLTDPHLPFLSNFV